MDTSSITNFIKVTDKIATSGQPTHEHLQAARDEGYQAIINLAPNDAENHALQGEQEIIRSLGMEYHHIPVEWGNPHTEQFEEFAGVMQELKDKKVLVHCAANYRVTAFYSLYAMKYQGWTAEQADRLIARVWESRPDYRMDDIWKSFIQGVRSNFE